jgi:hypothetical protein
MIAPAGEILVAPIVLEASVLAAAASVLVAAASVLVAAASVPEARDQEQEASANLELIEMPREDQLAQEIQRLSRRVNPVKPPLEEVVVPEIKIVAAGPSAPGIVRGKRSSHRFQGSRFRSCPIRRESNHWRSRFACKDEPIPSLISLPWCSNALTVSKFRHHSNQTAMASLFPNSGSVSSTTRYGFRSLKPLLTFSTSTSINSTTAKELRPLHQKATLAL